MRAVRMAESERGATYGAYPRDANGSNGQEVHHFGDKLPFAPDKPDRVDLR